MNDSVFDLDDTGTGGTKIVKSHINRIVGYPSNAERQSRSHAGNPECKK